MPSKLQKLFLLMLESIKFNSLRFWIKVHSLAPRSVDLSIKKRLELKILEFPEQHPKAHLDVFCEWLGAEHFVLSKHGWEK